MIKLSARTGAGRLAGYRKIVDRNGTSFSVFLRGSSILMHGVLVMDSRAIDSDSLPPLSPQRAH
jgi:hypothetical protein